MIRSELIRSKPVKEPKPAKGPRQRKCSNCGTSFVQQRMGQQVCSLPCAQSFGRRISEQQRRKAERAERAETKAKLLEHKPLEYFEKKAEAACNAFIRARDPDICISCGVTHSSAWQAGHFISVGANCTLRYHEDNIHKQCIQCNMFKGSNAIEYEKRLFLKIGQERLDWLKSWHPTVKMTRAAAEEIEAHYKAKLKTLKESRND